MHKLWLRDDWDFHSNIIIIIVCILSQYIILTLIVVYKLLESNFHKLHNTYCKFYLSTIIIILEASLLKVGP